LRSVLRRLYEENVTQTAIYFHEFSYNSYFNLLTKETRQVYLANKLNYSIMFLEKLKLIFFKLHSKKH